MNRLRPSSKSVLASLALAGVVALFVLILATAAYAGVWLPGQQSSEPVSAPTALDALYRPSVATLPTDPYPWPKAKPKPTAAPVGAPAVSKASAPAAPSGSVAQRVAAAWPGDDNWALKTVACESGFNPKAVGGGGGNYYGLWQMGPWARSRYGNPLGQSVEQQTAAAWRLLKDAGSGQWACSPWSYHP